jgi:hypothetical protein
MPKQILLTYKEFRERAIPVAGFDKGSVVPYDIQLRANDEALLQGSLYSVKTNEDNVTLTLIEEKEETDD